MSDLDAPEAGPDLARTLLTVDAFRAAEERLTYIAAQLAIEIPHCAAKLALARAVHHHAHARADWGTRLAELAERPGAAAELSPPKGATVAERLAEYSGTAHTLEAAYRDHAARAHPISDEPTLRLIRSLQLEADDLLGRMTAASAEVAVRPEPAAPGHLTRDGYTPPVRPARAQVFLDSVVPPAPDPADLRQAALDLMHVNLTDLEFSTIEICCLFILQNRELPWNFVLDMARQAWDEARHAEAFIERIAELGGKLGLRPTNFSHWDIVQNQPLPVALTCHQMIGEWIGIDGAIWFGAHFRKNGDPATGRVFDFVARDECTHVHFGTTWIDRLVPDLEARQDVHRRAEAVRRSFSKAVEGPLAFPLTEWGCNAAGYPQFAIDRLKERYRASGSRLDASEG